MATVPHRTDVPLDASVPAAQLARVLRDMARSRSNGRCQIGACPEPARFVSCTVLASVERGAAGVNWSAVCVRHATIFAVATNTPRPGA
jgi:hypothetical protein